jgi:hypothetical protein
MERFEVEQSGASWHVVDTESLTTIGPARGQPRIVAWFGTQAQATAALANLNRTREATADEERCVDCGAPPANGEPPRCATHQSPGFTVY